MDRYQLVALLAPGFLSFTDKPGFLPLTNANPKFLTSRIRIIISESTTILFSRSPSCMPQQKYFLQPILQAS